MKPRYLIFHFLILALIVSFTTLGQSNDNGKLKITSNQLAGNWIVHHIDSIFGHKSSLQFTFAKKDSFIYEMTQDGKITEKYFGKFKILNDKNLIIEIPKKHRVNFEIISLIKDNFKIKEVGAKDVITLTRT